MPIKRRMEDAKKNNHVLYSVRLNNNILKLNF
jgi:hypothetical protein